MGFPCDGALACQKAWLVDVDEPEPGITAEEACRSIGCSVRAHRECHRLLMSSVQPH